MVYTKMAPLTPSSVAVQIAFTKDKHVVARCPVSRLVHLLLKWEISPRLRLGLKSSKFFRRRNPRKSRREEHLIPAIK
jgi:hypothetical protein